MPRILSSDFIEGWEVARGWMRDARCVKKRSCLGLTMPIDPKKGSPCNFGHLYRCPNCSFGMVLRVPLHKKSERSRGSKTTTPMGNPSSQTQEIALSSINCASILHGEWTLAEH